MILAWALSLEELEAVECRRVIAPSQPYGALGTLDLPMCQASVFLPRASSPRHESVNLLATVLVRTVANVVSI